MARFFPSHQQQVDEHDDDDDELIVGFPKAGRRRSMIDGPGFDDPPTPPSPTPIKNRNVHFSQMSTMAEFEIFTDEENKQKWTSSEDRKQFRRQQAADVLSMRRVFETTPYNEVPHEVLCHCIGIENLMSPKLIQRTLEHRANHTRIVLFEQRCQREMGEVDPERLASISEKHSSKTKLRARKLAEGYMKMKLT
mmetsp:Transcript_4288/g.8846  ORF Transcript_4288/g.8846 Transcript_4288/m.8846 type:complete len:194 (+) Transcript_4288:106-687(+)